MTAAKLPIALGLLLNVAAALRAVLYYRTNPEG